MRIGFDARMVEQAPGGNRRYTYDLLRALASLDGENDYVLYHRRSSRHLPRLDFRSSAWCRVRPSHPLLRLLFGLPVQLLRARVDVFHGQYQLPLWVGAPSVLTIHDVSFAQIPDLYSRQDRILTSILVSWAARRASIIITVSEHARQEIVRLYNFDPQRVVTIYEAAGAQFRPLANADAAEQVRNKYGIPPSYGLYVGRIEPRKNHIRLFEAWAHLRSRSEDEPALVIVGPKSFGYEDVFAAVSKFHLEHRVIFTGPIPEAELLALYSQARLFVYPSLYEGFGLPVLEAMQCGVPIIAANCTSIPEIVEDAGLLVDPYSVDDIADALTLLWHDEALRLSLREKGLARASQFSWHRTAVETRAVYERALQIPA